MNLTRLELIGFKSFAKKTAFDFTVPLVSIVGPNGSGKSNVAEGIRFVLGEQSMKSMRGKRGEDMIWNGSNAVPRMGKASVAITFNNQSRFLDIDFDEVVIERVVHRDGINEYKINGSTARLKDVLELMAGANIGASGHHIISQGEADKVLSASPRERREVLEDALGLKVYQYKKEEASRKLQKTEENMRQVEALRREVAPHLRFLKRQVDKIEKAEELKREGLARFQKYLKEEEVYVTKTRADVEERKRKAEALVADASAKMREAKESLSLSAESNQSREIVTLSDSLEEVRKERSFVARESARLGGSIETLSKASLDAVIPRKELEGILEEGERAFTESRGSIESITSFISSFFNTLRTLLSESGGQTSEIETLKREKSVCDEKEKSLAEREVSLAESLEKIRHELEEARVEERAKERSLFEFSTRERDARHQLSLLESEERSLKLEEEELKRDMAEAGAIFGRAVLDYAGLPEVGASRQAQEEEKRALEKIKIRLEEMGAAGGDEVVREYKEASERELFLEKELQDLTNSAESLASLIAELDSELKTRFKEGIGAINSEFTRLFALMFDGGTASLKITEEPTRRVKSLVDEDDNGIPDEMEETAVGVDISIHIPRKRIRSLTMLSGGERALTSIALIFAMSSVNPPPFLVLDETDAALDEANSRRYGDMVEALSEKSQLLLITHNRETMSRAGILYGVTMGGDGVSKVLSVKLEDAVKVAK